SFTLRQEDAFDRFSKFALPLYTFLECGVRITNLRNDCEPGLPACLAFREHRIHELFISEPSRINQLLQPGKIAHQSLNEDRATVACLQSFNAELFSERSA